MLRDLRRVVTGHNDNGNSVVIIDETTIAGLGHVLTPEGQPNVRLLLTSLKFPEIWGFHRLKPANTHRL